MQSTHDPDIDSSIGSRKSFHHRSCHPHVPCSQARQSYGEFDPSGRITIHFLDRPDCQYAAKAVRSATGESTKLDWMRMVRLAKVLVAHTELEWLYQAQDVPEKYVVRRLRLARLGNAKEHKRSIRTAWTQSPRIQLLDSARRSLKRTGRAVSNGTCGVGRGWGGSEGGSAHGQHGEPWRAQPYWSRASTTPGREMALGSGTVEAGRFSLKKVDTYSNVNDLTTKTSR